MSLTTNTYLTFNGNCREVMNYYCEILDGKLEIQNFDTAPMEIPEGYGSKVLHATLLYGESVLMASDSMPGQEVTVGNNFAISIGSDDLEKGRDIFNKLAEGGTVLMPFEQTFWGATFGACIDKYGINWMVNVENEQS